MRTQHSHIKGYEHSRDAIISMGLNLIPFNFFAHYADDAYGQSVHDDWLADYHFFHDNPVIMLSDGAYVKVDGKKTSLCAARRGSCVKTQEKEKT